MKPRSILLLVLLINIFGLFKEINAKKSSTTLTTTIKLKPGNNRPNQDIPAITNATSSTETSIITLNLTSFFQTTDLTLTTTGNFSTNTTFIKSSQLIFTNSTEISTTDSFNLPTSRNFESESSMDQTKPSTFLTTLNTEKTIATTYSSHFDLNTSYNATYQMTINSTSLGEKALISTSSETLLTTSNFETITTLKEPSTLSNFHSTEVLAQKISPTFSDNNSKETTIKFEEKFSDSTINFDASSSLSETSQMTTMFTNLFSKNFTFKSIFSSETFSAASTLIEESTTKISPTLSDSTSEEKKQDSFSSKTLIDLEKTLSYFTNLDSSSSENTKQTTLSTSLFNTSFGENSIFSSSSETFLTISTIGTITTLKESSTLSIVDMTDFTSEKFSDLTTNSDYKTFISETLQITFFSTNFLSTSLGENSILPISTESSSVTEEPTQKIQLTLSDSINEEHKENFSTRTVIKFEETLYDLINYDLSTSETYQITTVSTNLDTTTTREDSTLLTFGESYLFKSTKDIFFKETSNVMKDDLESTIYSDQNNLYTIFSTEEITTQVTASILNIVSDTQLNSKDSLEFITTEETKSTTLIESTSISDEKTLKYLETSISELTNVNSDFFTVDYSKNSESTSQFYSHFTEEKNFTDKKIFSRPFNNPTIYYSIQNEESLTTEISTLPSSNNLDEITEILNKETATNYAENLPFQTDHHSTVILSKLTQSFSFLNKETTKFYNDISIVYDKEEITSSIITIISETSAAGKSFLKNAIAEDTNDVFNPLPLFKQFDKNGDGKITEEDFVLAIEKLGLGEIGETMVKGVFEQIDTNGNGKLDLSEALKAYETIKSIFKKEEASS
ncbi:unnamed protein product [Brachionus calyciflorus]|uniref:EF-hand domain-containing protein n=1 Tax=Brachionus calyciflorus TaxID=104777 RepID=A0A813P9V8_9BILA|nr:unnamed protein product [Brachionus calyciflorus]